MAWYSDPAEFAGAVVGAPSNLYNQLNGVLTTGPASANTDVSDEHAGQIFTEAMDQAGYARRYGGPRNVAAYGQDQVYTDATPANYDVVKADTRGYAAALANAATASDKVADVNTNISQPWIGAAAQMQAARMQGADQARADQLAAIQAIGQGPSAAAARFGAAMGAIGQQQLGLANQARGVDRAGSRREAMITMGQQGIQAADASAAQAAQEEVAKRQAVAAGMAGLRSQDFSVSSAQAQLEQAAALQNQAALNEWELRKGQMTLDANKASVAAALQQQGTRAGLAQADASALTNVSGLNAGAQNTSSQFGAQAANTAAGNYATAQNQQARDVAAARIAQGAANATARNAASQNYANALNQAGQQNASNDLQAQNLRQGGFASAAGAANTAAGTEAQNAATRAGVSNQNADRTQKDTAAKLGLVSDAGAKLVTAMSDERVKRDVSQITDADLLDLADKLNAYSFRYKPGVADGGAYPHLGAMAQDLEKTKLGQALVARTPEGIRTVNYGELERLGPAMAAAAARAVRKGARA